MAQDEGLPLRRNPHKVFHGALRSWQAKLNIFDDHTPGETA